MAIVRRFELSINHNIPAETPLSVHLEKLDTTRIMMYIASSKPQKLFYYCKKKHI